MTSRTAWPRRVSALVLFASLAATMLLARCARPDASAAIAADAERFLSLFGSLYQGAYTVAARAAWNASTDVTPEHDAARTAAGQALAQIQGSPEVVATTRRLLQSRERLQPLVARQLDAALLIAAETPGTLPDLVEARVAAESQQSSLLDGYTFCLDRRGDTCLRPISANAIDNTLATSRDLDERLVVWNASKEIGGVLRPGLEQLRDLRNRLAREMGFDSFYALQVAEYGMSVEEMHVQLQGWIDETRPLYRQLHCWAKHELAGRYGQPVPKRIPAHWIDNRWAQSWGGIVQGIDLDPLFADRTPEWIVQRAEAFYVSMGFPALPQTFWERSDLYPVAPEQTRKKNTHASAWHLDLADDVRSLMSVESNARWFGTAHHELGHVYYYMAYTRPEVPLLLRAGANRGFHEGIGELINIASLQVPYLREIGLLPEDRQIDRVSWLLNEALTESMMFLPWAAGTMSAFERGLYEGELPAEDWNVRWWEHVANYQGVEPPAPRDPKACDGCTKTHVNDDPAQYYDYAVATVLKYQLHDHIARTILRSDPHEANYAGRRDVGDFLRSILEQGKTEDWRELLLRTTGEPLSARAMIEYFQPLSAWLDEQNAGRDCAWE